jgi:hypothetical protein
MAMAVLLLGLPEKKTKIILHQFSQPKSHDDGIQTRPPPFLTCRV